MAGLPPNCLIPLRFRNIARGPWFPLPAKQAPRYAYRQFSSTTAPSPNFRNRSFRLNLQQSRSSSSQTSSHTSSLSNSVPDWLLVFAMLTSVGLLGISFGMSADRARKMKKVASSEHMKGSNLEPSQQDSDESPPDSSEQSAFNPETGEINWDCPCLGGMAHGICGEQFKAAFSCFVYSEQEPKGVECIDKFKSMQDCFKDHPDVYGQELLTEEDPVAGEEVSSPEADANR